MIQLVLVRHGESEWNQENRFTGWTDVDLTEKGAKEARQAGKVLKKAGFVFDIAFTSVLKRAIRTMWLIQDEMDQFWVPDIKTWRLNERHYGALQGLNKAEIADRYGKEQVRLWRRGYLAVPPPLTPDDPRYPGHDPRYAGLTSEEIPLTESLEMLTRRFLPCWENEILPKLWQGKKILIVAHHNTLRALCELLDHLTEEQVMNLEIPTGIPVVYELDEQLHPLKHFFLS